MRRATLGASTAAATGGRRHVAALAVACALLLTSCATEPAGSEGWTRVEDTWLALDVPSSWAATGELTARWTASWQDVEGADATVQLAASPRLGYLSALEGRGVVLAAAQVGGLPGFEVVNQTDVVHSDELELTRTDFRYEPEGADAPYDGVLWVAADPDERRAVAVQLTGPDLPDAVVDRVESSISIRPVDAAPAE